MDQNMFLLVDTFEVEEATTLQFNLSKKSATTKSI